MGAYWISLRGQSIHCDLGDFWNFGENGRMRLRDGGWLGRGQFLGRHWEEAPGIPPYNAWCVLLLLE